MPFPAHADRARWQREHPGTFLLHRFLPVSDDGTPASFPRALALGRGSTADPAYWSSGRVRPGDGYWIFHYALRGAGLLVDAAGRHPVPAGSGMLVRADDAASTFGYPPDAAARWEWLWCDFRGAAAMAMAGDLVARHGPVFAPPSDDPTVRWMRAVTATERARTVPPWDARERVWRLLGSLAEAGEAASVRSEDAFILATRRRIAQRLTDHELTVEGLAHDLGVSREHLTRTFRRVAGTSPRRHIEELRLGLAVRLLRETGLPIAAVAHQCGWRDAETFASAFRREYGRTPGAWRAAGS
jgi:AraC-like DNA-binding protein